MLFGQLVSERLGVRSSAGMLKISNFTNAELLKKCKLEIESCTCFNLVLFLILVPLILGLSVALHCANSAYSTAAVRANILAARLRGSDGRPRARAGRTAVRMSDLPPPYSSVVLSPPPPPPPYTPPSSTDAVAERPPLEP